MRRQQRKYTILNTGHFAPKFESNSFDSSISRLKMRFRFLQNLGKSVFLIPPSRWMSVEGDITGKKSQCLPKKAKGWQSSTNLFRKLLQLFEVIHLIFGELITEVGKALLQEPPVCTEVILFFYCGSTQLRTSYGNHYQTGVFVILKLWSPQRFNRCVAFVAKQKKNIRLFVDVKLEGHY